MMQTVQTPEGYKTILEDKDVLELVEKYISDDVAEYLAEKLGRKDEEELYAEMRFDSDLDAMEGEVENYQNMLQDVSEGLEQIMNYIDNVERINRSKVFIMVEKLNDKVVAEL